MPENIKLGGSADFTSNLKQLLASPNICGKRWVWQQYDHMVQTNTVEAPGAGDAGVIRIKGSQRGLAMALDGNGRWCYLDPRLGAMHAVAEAARKVACSGATPVGATNCLNFGNPEKPHIMWQFSQTIDGITKACEELEIPITGGNVSFYNETLGEGIYPTPVLGVVGILEDVHKAAKMHFAGDRAHDRAIARGRSGRYHRCGERVWVVGVREGNSGDAVGISAGAGSGERSCAAEGGDRIDSARAWWSRCMTAPMGDLAVALAEKAMPKGVGARVNLASGGLFAEFALFGEDASRIVISCDPGHVARIKEVAEKHGAAADVIGETVPEQLEISLDGKVVVSAAVSELSEAYEGALESALRTDPELVTAG